MNKKTLREMERSTADRTERVGTLLIHVEGVEVILRDSQGLLGKIRTTNTYQARIVKGRIITAASAEKADA